MRIFQPLRGTPVALLWGGMSLSALGDQLYAVALTWIAVEVLGSNAGYLSALQALVTLLAVLGIGRWADRWDRLRGMIGADFARALVLLAVVAVWSATGGPGVAQLACAIVVLAAGQAVFQPALQSVLPSLVDDPRLLPAANGLLDATSRTARLLGPGLVALLASAIPVRHFLTVDAVSFLASAAALLLVRRLRPGPQADAAKAAPEPLWRGIARGRRATAVHPLVGYFFTTTGVLNGAWYAVFFLGLPLMIGSAKSPAANGLSAYGLILSAYGCMNLAATMVFGGRSLPSRPQFQMFAGVLVTGSGIVLLGLANTLPAEWKLSGFAAVAALTAMGGPMSDIPLAVLRQLRLRAPDVPAAMRVHIAMTNAGILLAMLLMPVAFGRVGVAPVIVACGIAYLAVAITGLARHAAWIEVSGPQPA